MNKRITASGLVLVALLAAGSPVTEGVSNLQSLDPSLHDHQRELVGTGPTTDDWLISAVSGVSGTVHGWQIV